MSFKVVNKVEAQLQEKEKAMIYDLITKLKEKDYNENTLFEEFYIIIKKHDSSPSEFFKVCYNVLINKDKGPKLAPFILQIGKDRVIKILEQI